LAASSASSLVAVDADWLRSAELASADQSEAVALAPGAATPAAAVDVLELYTSTQDLSKVF